MPWLTATRQFPCTIDDDPLFQLRRCWEPHRDASLQELAASLAGPEGLVHPIVVVARATPTTFGRLYTLVTGHRRVAAARHLRWERIPARILPPCDLGLPQERLRLLAMAIRENTERVPLEAADRRAALERLHQLYEEVHPTRRAPVAAEKHQAFAQWAAGVTRIPARTIRHDLRQLFGAPVASRQREASVNEPLASAQEPFPTALALGQQTSAALQTLAASLAPGAPEQMVLAPDDYVHLVEILEDLQATVTLAWTATAMPTGRSLDAFALQVQQRLPPLLGALRGLATSPPTEWEQAPPLLLRALQQTMATLFQRWAQVETLLSGAHPQPATRLRDRST